MAMTEIMDLILNIKLAINASGRAQRKVPSYVVAIFEPTVP